MGERPWFKFYPTDWRADQALRLCSAAARGLWLECLCLMHESEPYGHLLVNGRQVSDVQLANLTGIAAAELAPLLEELDTAGVFTRTDEGVITSRRMIRDAARAREGARYGKLGGNPALKGQGRAEPSPRVQSPGIQNPDSDRKDSDLAIEGLSSALSSDLSPASSSELAESAPHFGAKKPWTPEQKRAAWQSRVCAWAQAELPTEAYANFLNGWANGERWAQLKAEEFSAAMNSARRRKTVGAYS